MGEQCKGTGMAARSRGKEDIERGTINLVGEGALMDRNINIFEGGPAAASARAAIKDGREVGWREDARECAL